jgi:hypothetical protein
VWLAKNLSSATRYYLTNTCHAWEQLSLFDLNVSADSIIKIAGHFDIHMWRRNNARRAEVRCRKGEVFKAFPTIGMFVEVRLFSPSDISDAGKY